MYCSLAIWEQILPLDTRKINRYMMGVAAQS
jgi:hypothetical protein